MLISFHKPLLNDNDDNDDDDEDNNCLSSVSPTCQDPYNWCCIQDHSATSFLFRITHDPLTEDPEKNKYDKQ